MSDIAILDANQSRVIRLPLCTPVTITDIRGSDDSRSSPDGAVHANGQPDNLSTQDFIRAAVTLGEPKEKMCHYVRHLIATGHPLEHASRTCPEIRADGFNGCPGSEGCLTPDGGVAGRPDDLNRRAGVEKFHKLSQRVVAQTFLDAQYRDGCACVGNLFYGYDNGVYRIVEEAELIQQLLEIFGYGIKVSDAQQLLKYIKYQTREPADIFKPNKKLVCFRNGVLNVETGELGPHDPAHRLVNSIDADYVSTAECQRWLQALREMFRDDPDREQKTRFIRQWMGYLLITDASFQKMLYLLGNGANGKSLFCKVVEAMVGRENVSHAMLNRLGRAAVRAEIAGKLVNISSDLPAQALTGDGYIKSIVSGDPIEAERKYKDSCTITPFARLMVATNSMPHSSDDSDGYFRRIIILTFNRTFAPEEQNPNLENELLQEMPGIIAWAVEGLRDLLAQQEFSIPPSSLVAVAAYRSDVNPVQQFAEECLVPSPDQRGWTAKGLLEVFDAWRKAHNQKSCTSIGFGRALANLGFQSRKVSHTVWLVALKSGAELYHPKPWEGPALT
ncbi:DNA primase family protein [Paraburkholderia sp. MM6662-R1]|uniref:DNA primase family protein n=1 Tax=Paraburkholderia sp. MM6662-R1 TaxID=2991066 RepID=UPI003D234252